MTGRPGGSSVSPPPSVFVFPLSTYLVGLEVIRFICFTERAVIMYVCTGGRGDLQQCSSAVPRCLPTCLDALKSYGVGDGASFEYKP